MKNIVELAKWDDCGTGKLEQYIKTIVSTGNYAKVSSSNLNKIFELKGIPLKPIDDYEYYIYHNYHPSSGYKTYFYINDNDEIAFEIHKPKGMVLCAFWNEVIIFSVEGGSK